MKNARSLPKKLNPNPIILQIKFGFLLKEFIK